MSRARAPGPANPWPLFRPLDFLVAAAILAGAALALPRLAAPLGGRAEVFVEGVKAARLDLEGPPRRLEVATRLGPLSLEYGEGGVRVARAPCPNQLCVRMGRAAREGQALVCLPSRVRAEVTSLRKHAGYDAVTF